MAKNSRPLDTKIPTIMQYIKTKVPKDGLMNKKFQVKVKNRKFKPVV